MKYSFQFNAVLNNKDYLLGGVLLTLQVMAVSYVRLFNWDVRRGLSPFQTAGPERTDRNLRGGVSKHTGPCPVNVDLLLFADLYRNRYRSNHGLCHSPRH